MLPLTPQLMSKPTPPGETTPLPASRSTAHTLPMAKPYPEWRSGMPTDAPGIQQWSSGGSGCGGVGRLTQEQKQQLQLRPECWPQSRRAQHVDTLPAKVAL